MIRIQKFPNANVANFKTDYFIRLSKDTSKALALPRYDETSPLIFDLSEANMIGSSGISFPSLDLFRG